MRPKSASPKSEPHRDLRQSAASRPIRLTAHRLLLTAYRSPFTATCQYVPMGRG